MNKTVLYRISVLSIFLFFSFMPTVFALPIPTCDVCAFGCDYTSIQDAIDDADSGDEIYVCNGTYYENIDFLGKAITVQSMNGPDTTIIEGGTTGSVALFENSEGSDSVLEGFTLTGGSGMSPGSYGGGIYCDGTSPIIDQCIIEDNSALSGGGIYLSSSSAQIRSSTIRSNLATANDGGGIYCVSSTPMITDTTIIMNSAGRNGGGIYSESSTVTLVNTTLEHNWATTLSHGYGGGLYLEDSSADLTNCTLTENQAGDNGGGIYADLSSTSLTILDSTITNNSADNQGGGIFCDSASISFTSTTLNGNDAGIGGGGLCLYLSTGSISECTFSENHTNHAGGALAMFLSLPTIEDTSFINNTAGEAGAGIWCNDSSTPTISRCIISRNTSDSDGGALLITLSSSPTVVNTFISDNIVLDGSGGGISIYSSSLSMMNSTVRRNRCTRNGGGLYTQLSSVTITNSIFWDNLSDEISNWGGDDPVITFSDVEGGYPGAGNIDEAPFFVTGNDSHIRSLSPCIDSGTPTGAPATDIDGDSRPQSASYDMGADEFTEINYPVPEILVNGMDGVVNISQALIDEITITVSLDSYGRTDNMDWWLAQVGPYGIFYLTPSMWTPVQTPFYQGPLFPIATYGFPPTATSGLATGTYILYFAVDTVVDGWVSFDDIYTSFVIVNITR